MTQETPAQIPPQPAPVSSPAPTPSLSAKSKRARSPRLWPLWLLSLVIIAGMAALAWLGWQQLQQRQAAVEDVRAAVQQQQSRVNDLEARYQERLNALDRHAQQATAEVERLEAQLAKSAQQLLAMGAKTRTDWLLAEAEYLLRLANQRLMMERDPQGALAILQGADQVLRETDETAMYPVRRQLAQEIVALQNVAELDRTGIFLQLDALAGGIAQLQQRMEQEVPTVELDEVREQAATSGWRGALAELWGEVKQLVVVRRTNEPVEPLLPPKDIFFLQQNLRLMLEQAQLALLEKNQELYDSSLRKAEDWVRRFFATSEPGDNARAQRFLDNLAKLQEIKVDPELPDISASLRQLKTLVDSLYQSGAVSAPSNTADTASQPTPSKQDGGAE